MTRTEGVPVELITEAQKSYQQLRATIKRRGAGGKIYACAVPTMTPQELLGIEVYCIQNGGGGDYEIDVGDLKKPGTALFGFKINVEGEPRVWPNQQQAGAPAVGPIPGQPVLAPQFPQPVQPVAPQAPGWQQVIDPNTQQLVWVQAPPNPQAPVHTAMGPAPGYAPQPMPPTAWTAPMMRGSQRWPDAIATEAWQGERARVDQLGQQRETERKRSDEQMEVLRRELAEMRSAGERERNDIRVADLERRLADRPQGATIDWAGIATVAGGLFTALFTAQGQRAHSAQEQHAKSLEAMTNMVTANKAESPVTQLATLAPVLAPLIKEYFSANDPAKQAKVVAVMGDQVLQQTRVAMEAIKMLSEAGGDKPAWLGVIEEIRIGAERMAEQFSSGGGAAPPGWGQQGGAPFPMQQQQVPFQQQPDAAHQAEVVNGAPPNAQAVGAAAQAGSPGPAMGPEDIVQGLLASPQYPGCLKTKPWADISYHVLLEATVNIQPIAEAMVEALTNSERAGQLDPYFAAVMQEPKMIGDTVLAYLPSWQTNREYCDKLVAAFVRERQSPTVVVTPPPAADPTPVVPQQTAQQTAQQPAPGADPQEPAAAEPVTAAPPTDNGPTFVKPPPEATHRGTGKPIETH